MSDMKKDLEHFSKIWDKALENGAFKEKEKDVEPEKTFNTDFFGQYLTSEYDIDRPLNEVDAKYWAAISREIDPLIEQDTTKQLKASAEAIGNSHNPILPNTVGKDQEINVAQNWGVGGEKIQELEKLKVELFDLESKLNSLVSNEDSKEEKTNSIQSKIDSLKKEIDKISDTLSGTRFEEN